VDPLLIGSIVASIVVMLLMVVFVQRIGRLRAESAARVEALHVMVAEAADGIALESSKDVSAELAHERDDWDLELLDKVNVDLLPLPPASRRVPNVVSRPAHPFVVTVGGSGAGRYQMSFKRAGQ
jgi:hypothetical protein